MIAISDTDGKSIGYNSATLWAKRRLLPQYLLTPKWFVGPGRSAVRLICKIHQVFETWKGPMADTHFQQTPISLEVWR
jgi:hypothetical protein